MKLLRLSILSTALITTLAGFAAAQSMAVGFNGLKQDPNAPVEVTSDTLVVEREKGIAVFTGNVLVIQGEMRMTAPRVDVSYGTDGTGITDVHATGGVTLVTSVEAAESREATYQVATGDLVMTGDVVMTQGGATVAGDRMTADLTLGTGQMHGRVKTIFKPSEKAKN